MEMKMRKLSVVGLLCILVTAAVGNAVIEVPLAPARMNMAIVSGGVPSAPAASCQVGTKESYTAGDTNGMWWGNSGTTKYAFAFTPGSNYKLCKLEVALYKDGTCTGTIAAALHLDATGAPAATATYTATGTISANLAATPTYYSWDFNNEDLSSGTIYWVVLTIGGTACGGNDLATQYGSTGTEDLYTYTTSWGAAAANSKSNYKTYSYE